MAYAKSDSKSRKWGKIHCRWQTVAKPGVPVRVGSFGIFLHLGVRRGVDRDPEERRKRRTLIDPSGYDAGKKIEGKKRHILVDTIRLLLHAVVHHAALGRDHQVV